MARSFMLRVRMTVEEEARLRERAALVGMEMSAFVRLLLAEQPVSQKADKKRTVSGQPSPKPVQPLPMTYGHRMKVPAGACARCARLGRASCDWCLKLEWHDG